MKTQEVWFEEELVSCEESPLVNPDAVSLEVSSSKQRYGIVRAQKPEWDFIQKPPNFSISGHETRLCKVRLGFEFDIDAKNLDSNYHFSYAKCTAHMWAKDNTQPDPWVYDIFPREIYEGEPQKITLKFSPEIKVDKIGVSVGEIGTDISTGRITPTVIGYLGDEKKYPRWEIRPKGKMLLGIQYFWLVIAMPMSCEKIRLSSQIEANIEKKVGFIRIGPKDRLWENRPSIEIG